jgi:hypothetical protein
MNQDGYTLAETLAALVIIGLAVGGLVGGFDLLGRVQAKAAASANQADQRSRLETEFARFLEHEGPFRSADDPGLRGDGAHFSYACGARVCTAELDGRNGQTQLVLTGRDGAARSTELGKGAFVFEYEDDLGQEPDWPPADPDRPRTLSGIAIVRLRLGEVLPVAMARVFAEQAAKCAFDSISRTCRVEAAP